jgi:hypothetical protein
VFLNFDRPRDGKNITMARLEAALMEALHMSGAAAHAISQPLKPLLRKDGTFDLVDARVHNVAEHDRSLTRFDFRQGDNYTMQPKSESIRRIPRGVAVVVPAVSVS